MASLRPLFGSFLLLPLLLSYPTVRADEIILNQYQYCIKYFGSVRAELTLPEEVLDKNYNNTIRCPTDWSFPTERGATLTLCPPSSSLWNDDSDGITLEAKLEFYGDRTGVLSRPLDAVTLRNLLITNGSVPGPFTNGGKPAVIVEGPARSTTYIPAWTINGTEKSMIDNPTNTSRREGFYLSCNNLSEKQRFGQYCGFAQDEDADGCWISQTYVWSMTGPGAVNYTIRFSDVEASVEFFTRQEHFRSSDGEGTGFFDEAYVVFGGGRALPSIVDYAYWQNSMTDYETEKAALNDFHLRADDQRFPVFVNMSERAETYSTRNGTYTGRSAGAG